MERTPTGTPVGVDDPYAHVDRCDHLTGDGRCRLAVARPEVDPAFARERAADGYQCAAADPDPDWARCPRFRATAPGDTCRRCGLERRPNALRSDRRPLLEAHHLSYADRDIDHEITVTLCRWCHAKVHRSWARIDDAVGPDPEAIAERERRLGEEYRESTFETAARRRDA